MEYLASPLTMDRDDENDSGNTNRFSEDFPGVQQDPQTELTAGSRGSQRPHSEPTPNWYKCNVNQWLKRLRINELYNF